VVWEANCNAHAKDGKAGFSLGHKNLCPEPLLRQADLYNSPSATGKSGDDASGHELDRFRLPVNGKPVTKKA